MSNNKNFKLPETALFTDDKGNTTSLIDVLGGKELAIESGHHTYKTPNTAMMIDDEGNLYNLIDVIKNAVGNSNNSNNQGTTGQGGQAGGSGVEDSDKVDYIGEQHKTLKETNDANVEYLLREINTAHYEGTNVTATDTYQKRVKSAMFKGQTLVNIHKKQRYQLDQSNETLEANKLTNIVNGENQTTFDMADNKAYGWGSFVRGGNLDLNMLKPNTKYLVYFGVAIFPAHFGVSFRDIDGANLISTIAQINKGTNYAILTTTNEIVKSSQVVYISIPQEYKGHYEFKDIMIIEYQNSMENWNIPYFEGMQSTKSPVLTTIGENLIGECINPTERRKKYKAHLKPNTRYTLNYRNSEGGGTSNGGVWLLNGDTELAFFGYSYTMRFTTPSNISDTTVLCIDSWNNDISVLLVEGDEFQNLSLEAISRKPYQSTTLTTPSDLILRGIGDVHDTLDLMTGEVVQRVEYTEHLLQDVFNFSNGFGRGIIYNEETDRWIGAHNGINQSYFNNMLPLNFSITDNKNSNVSIYKVNGDWFGFSVKSSELIAKGYEATANGLLNYAKNEKMKCFYKLATPIKKPSIDLKGQKIYSYDGTTHYTCTSEENHPAPILSIDVPTNLSALVSRQRDTIQSLTVENQEIKEVNEAQDIEIEMNQDAINFILFAQTVKSVNEEKGEVNIMAVYLANQIIKGRLDYALVVSRYPEFKEDIDTILIAEGRQDLIK